MSLDRLLRRELVFGVVIGVSLVGLGLPGVAASAARATVPAPPTYQWPESNQNSSLTGVSADPSINTANASELGVKWMTYTGNEILASPITAWNAALGETLVYVGNDWGTSPRSIRSPGFRSGR